MEQLLATYLSAGMQSSLCSSKLCHYSFEKSYRVYVLRNFTAIS